MKPLILFLLSSLFTLTLPSRLLVEPPRTNAQITVVGLVYCDICSNNSFSRHSYFMSDAEVGIECKFKASTTKTSEQITFSVNRTTNGFGMYELEIPSVDGISCTESTFTSSCKATLMWSSSKSCNVPGYRSSTSDEFEIKASKANSCIYSLNALNFRPSNIDATLCGNN